MNRNSDLEKYIEEYRAERIELKKNNFNELNMKLKPVFCDKLNFLIEDQRLEKREGPKVEVFYLCRLLSSDHTESYRSVLGISNARLFLDRNRSQTYWYPEHIYKGIENDMTEVEKRLRKKFVRIQEYELLYLKYRLLMDDWEVLKDCFGELAREHIHILGDSCVDTEPEIKVMCGDYMEQLQLKFIHLGRRDT